VRLAAAAPRTPDAVGGPPPPPPPALTDEKRRARDYAAKVAALALDAAAAAALPDGAAQERALSAVERALADAALGLRPRLTLAASEARLPRSRNAVQRRLDDKLLVFRRTVAEGYDVDARACLALCRQAARDGFLLKAARRAARVRGGRATGWPGPRKGALEARAPSSRRAPASAARSVTRTPP
jgi:hypothetical protein